MSSPLEQFIIRPIFYIDNKYLNILNIGISNSTIILIISLLVIILLFSTVTFTSSPFSRRILIGRKGVIIMMIYKAIEGIARELMPKEYKKYIPTIVGLFIFVLVNNLIGLVPYGYTITSHIIVTITMSLTIILGVTIIGIIKHRLSFINLFIPSGLNQGGVKIILPLIFMIEVISYIIRIISLSVRLTANIMSGHTLLKIVSNFSLMGLKSSLSLFTSFTTLFSSPILKSSLIIVKLLILLIVIILPTVIIGGIYILEIGVAIIQSYVFTLLTTSYLKDAELLH